MEESSSSMNDSLSSPTVNDNTALITEVSESPELMDVYCFETDHVALKGNKDYQNLLKVICTLEAQRIQAVVDIDILHSEQKQALGDPIAFVDKLQKGEDLQFPKPLNVAQLPSINWEQYTSSVDFSSFGNHRHMTRIKRQLTDGNTDEPTSKPTENDIVRGRLKDSNKSATFNVLWTTEEQKRLESLLTQYPPEEVEAKRWHKIATALGNRTTKQVASRIQKYFLKLTKAGLPVPGRTPTTSLFKKNASRHHNRHTLHQHSTFLQSHLPPVYMSDDEDESRSYSGSFVGMETEQKDSSDEEDDIPRELHNTPEYRELVQLKYLRKQKLLAESKQLPHTGYKCDKCDCDPIIGTRWHCTDCPDEESIDLCEDCVDSVIEINNHNSSHRLKPIERSEQKAKLDEDYMRFIPGDYNYLDPNYMPAS